jgi:hypothetical protein
MRLNDDGGRVEDEEAMRPFAPDPSGKVLHPAIKTTACKVRSVLPLCSTNIDTSRIGQT